MTAASGADREEVRADFWQDYADGHPDAVAYVAASGADQPTLRDQDAEPWWIGAPSRYDKLRPKITRLCAQWRDENGKPEELADWFVAMLAAGVDRARSEVEADRERAKAEGGAEALEQAAARVPRWSPEVIAKWLRERAAALRGSTGGAR